MHLKLYPQATRITQWWFPGGNRHLLSGAGESRASLVSRGGGLRFTIRTRRDLAVYSYAHGP